MTQSKRHQSDGSGDRRTPRTPSPSKQSNERPHAIAQLLRLPIVLGIMRRSALSVPLVSAMLVIAASTSVANARPVTGNCAPTRSRVLLADSQAVVYTVTERSRETLEGPHGPSHFVVRTAGIWGCIQGQRRSYRLGGVENCSAGGAASFCSGIAHEALDGTAVAYEEFSVSSELNEEQNDQWHVVVRDLRTGRVLHRLPTGTPLKTSPGYVGVGVVAAIVVKSNGSVAWIADDYERSSGVGTPSETRYSDVEAVDSSGSRLLASGVNVDPSSLALAGSTLYWTQGGKPASTALH
jgi:hypothetical protein